THQIGSLDGLVAGNERSVKTNRRSINQAIKWIDQPRQSARFANLLPDQRFNRQSRKLRHPLMPTVEAQRALHPSSLQQSGELKEADDGNVYPVPLLLGAAEDLSAFAAHPRCVTAGEKHQWMSVSDVGDFEPER